MEHAIGSVITLPDGRKAEVVESHGSCDGCAIVNSILCKNIRCMAAERIFIDRKDIIYKEIKEE